MKIFNFVKKTGPFFGACRNSAFSVRVDAYLLFVAPAALEFHRAVDERKQGIVASDAYVVAWIDFRSPLADEYITRENRLAVPAFYS